MRTLPILDREQIAALPINQVEPLYEKAKCHLDGLLDKVERDSGKRDELQDEILATKKQYVLLRSRQYPKHFAKIYMAG